jgi:hypothetical protein
MEVRTCMKKKLTTASMVLLLLAPFLFGSCAYVTGQTGDSGEGFAIYLTRYDIPVSQMEKLSHVEIADRPVITQDDIGSYRWATQEIRLTEAGWDKVQQVKPPVSGTPFIVCVNKQPVYWGAFWTPVSSQSFDGITIWTPSFNENINTISIGLGYPGAGFFTGEDTRFNPLIKDALEKAGKLK